MRSRLQPFLLAALLAVAMASAPKSAHAQTNPFEGIPVTATSALGTFVGTLDIERFASQGGALFAVGQLTGTVTPTVGEVIEIARRVVIRVLDLDVSGSCTILDLTLGPIDLDLLGLVIETNTIHLEITAQTGSGKLLGNLLCAIASILDDGGPLSDLAGLLNNILRILG